MKDGAFVTKPLNHQIQTLLKDFNHLKVLLLNYVSVFSEVKPEMQ
jgi:hypothetical protein